MSTPRVPRSREMKRVLEHLHLVGAVFERSAKHGDFYRLPSGERFMLSMSGDSRAVTNSLKTIERLLCPKPIAPTTSPTPTRA